MGCNYSNKSPSLLQSPHSPWYTYMYMYNYHQKKEFDSWLQCGMCVCRCSPVPPFHALFPPIPPTHPLSPTTTCRVWTAQWKSSWLPSCHRNICALYWLSTFEERLLHAFTTTVFQTFIFPSKSIFYCLFVCIIIIMHTLMCCWLWIQFMHQSNIW